VSAGRDVVLCLLQEIAKSRFEGRVELHRRRHLASRQLDLSRTSLRIPLNQSVITLIIFAYKMKISESFGGLMRNLPSWAITNRFDINARAESGKPTKEDMRWMMQSLLEDRFKLKVHREKREMPVFGLYLAKPGKTGPQLKPHNPTSPCSAPLPSPAAGTPSRHLLDFGRPSQRRIELAETLILQAVRAFASKRRGYSSRLDF
jgi:uncharacterized protein (TIGR03435 family)